MSTHTIEEIMQKLRTFRSERNWEPYHTPKNLASSIAIEASELLELFQWIDTAGSNDALQDEALRASAADELADILIYCLYFADRAGIDPLRAVAEKMETNRDRFPAP